MTDGFIFLAIVFGGCFYVYAMSKGMDGELKMNKTFWFLFIGFAVSGFLAATL